jgi:hypothetical protein
VWNTKSLINPLSTGQDVTDGVAVNSLVHLLSPSADFLNLLTIHTVVVLYTVM